jgi:hypothetical protein
MSFVVLQMSEDRVGIAVLTQSFPFGVVETFLDQEAQVWQSLDEISAIYFPSSDLGFLRNGNVQYASSQTKSSFEKFIKGGQNFPWRAFLFELQSIMQSRDRNFIRKVSALANQGFQAGVRISQLMSYPRFDVYYAYWCGPDAWQRK